MIMDLENINDHAFDLAEEFVKTSLTAREIRNYFFSVGGKTEELDYFLVFLKHWIDNKRDLQWSDILLMVHQDKVSDLRKAALEDKEMNKDVKRRNEILGPFSHSFEVPGQITRFSKVNYFTLKQLIDEDFLKINDSWNNAPEVEVFLDFLRENSQFTCHGYAVNPEREDYRISIEGVHFEGDVTLDLVVPFVNNFRHADEFIVTKDKLYCWYD